MTNDSSAHLALLIDADNVTPKILLGLMAEVARLGVTSVRRCYGDWTNPALKNWKPLLLSHSILPIQHFAYTTKKNSTDGAMIIDAMDLLYTGRFSAFCIVSSDSDFTRLAARIREQGVTVYGFGERKTNNAFIAACTKFTYFDVLDMPTPEPDESPATAATAKAGMHSKRPLVPKRPEKRPFDSAALEGLAQAVMNSLSSDGRYADLGQVGAYLSRRTPDLNPRNYGYRRLHDFVQASKIVKLKWFKTSDRDKNVMVRLRRTWNKRYGD